MMDPSSIKELKRRLRLDPTFKPTYELMRANTSGATYFVGGKIYRNLVEMTHGMDCAAKSADWDFLCAGEVVRPMRAKVIRGYSVSLPYYGKENSLCLVRHDKGPKIDIIGARDIGPELPAYLNKVRRGYTVRRHYFDVVPLDIQTLAFDFENGRLYERKALRAIKRKALEINNAKGALPGLEITPYLEAKAASLGFMSGPRTYKTPCDCFGSDTRALWLHGCQHPALHI